MIMRKKIQARQSIIDILNTQYELFKMSGGESIQYMHTEFTSIVNELMCPGENIMMYKFIRNVLSIPPSLWESNINAISEVKDHQIMMMDEVIRN